MAYVAPNWKNGQAPALDAAALQAISDAIVANQTKNTQQDASISSLQTAVNGKSRVATGSYTGTGTYGSSNPNSITFPFAPKLFILQQCSNYNNKGFFFGEFILYWQYGMTDLSVTSTTNHSSNSIYKMQSFVQSGTKITWYSNSAYNQMNENRTGYKYYWVAFG